MKLTQERMLAGVEWACLLLAAWFTCIFLYISLNSLNYPFTLEWMEGQTVDIILRLMEGKPFYTTPTLEYVPPIYTPLYYYLCAAISHIIGVDFFAGRAVSLIATIWTGYILYLFVRREGGSPQNAALGAGIFFGTYHLSGRWFDLARIDSLFLLLLMAGLYVFLYWKGTASAVLAAGILTLAFFTKQLAIAASGIVIAGWLMIDMRRAIVTGGTLGLLVLAGVIYGNWVSGGWFGFFVFTVPASHDMQINWPWEFLSNDLMANVAVMMFAVGFAFVKTWRMQPTAAYRLALLLAACFAIACLGRMHSKGWINVLIPLHAALAVALAAGLAAVRRHGDAPTVMVFMLLLLTQTVTLLYWPGSLVPREKDMVTNSQFFSRLQKYSRRGEVFIPHLQFVQRYYGIKSYTFGMAGVDMLRARLDKQSDGARVKLWREYNAMLAGQHFGAILAPQRLTPIDPILFLKAKKYYDVAETLEYRYGYALESNYTQTFEVHVPKGNTVPPENAAVPKVGNTKDINEDDNTP